LNLTQKAWYCTCLSCLIFSSCSSIHFLEHTPRTSNEAYQPSTLLPHIMQLRASFL
jgi:hypothetical protein